MKKSKLATLNTPEARLRVISALILAPVVLGVVVLGGPSFAGLMVVVMATALYEWLRLVDPTAPDIERYTMLALLVLILVLTAAGLSLLGFFVLAIGAAAFYAHRSNVNPPQAFWFALGLPYLAGSGMALIALRATPVIGLDITAYLIAVVWGMDIGAYFSGRLIGGPKLAPSISPNKTWSGFIGGIMLAMILSGLVMLMTRAHAFGVGLGLAAVLGAVAQGGDLFKSFFKRRAGVKDCGTLIPGHGGVLDRIDGLVVAALALALLQSLFGSRMIW